MSALHIVCAPSFSLLLEVDVAYDENIQNIGWKRTEVKVQRGRVGHGRLEKVETKTPASGRIPTVARPMTASCLILAESDINHHCVRPHLTMSPNHSSEAIDHPATSRLRDNS
jgi:hypothetical protein